MQADPPNPLALFRDWHELAKEGNRLLHPGAVCLSTVDERNLPQARFVDLKAVTERGFVFCTHLNSQKARDLALNDSAALTFWWDHIERQVRVAGRAQRISASEDDIIFQERSRDAQLTTWASHQSAPMSDPTQIEEGVDAVRQRFANGEIPRPPHWGGFCLVPSRMEFLVFQSNRQHERIVFERQNDDWVRYLLQP